MIFKENPNPSKAEFFELLQKHTGDKVLHRKSRSFEDANENGFGLWPFPGTAALAEGSVNFVAKVQPNGRILSVSTSITFFEGMPIVWWSTEKPCPRVVAVTPPMFFNSKAKIGPNQLEAKQVKKSTGKFWRGIASARPREEVVREQMKEVMLQVC